MLIQGGGEKKDEMTDQELKDSQPVFRPALPNLYSDTTETFNLGNHVGQDGFTNQR